MGGYMAKLDVGMSSDDVALCKLMTVVDDKTILLTIATELAKFGCLHPKYYKTKKKTMMMLMRAKAMSLKDRAPDCPIISVLADRVLFLTAGHHVNDRLLEEMMKYNQTFRSGYVRFPDAKISDAARETVAIKQGISVELQLQIELKIANWTGGALDVPLEIFDQAWVDNWDKYATNSRKTILHLNRSVDTERLIHWFMGSIAKNSKFKDKPLAS
jgi:hypothetical protein